MVKVEYLMFFKKKGCMINVKYLGVLKNKIVEEK